jgi:hypothetical protein
VLGRGCHKLGGLGESRVHCDEMILAYWDNVPQQIEVEIEEQVLRIHYED